MSKKYILWNPDSEKPPKRVYHDKDAAIRTAQWAAGKSPTETFYVCEIIDGYNIAVEEDNGN
jgi:hypothetical protein